MSPVWTSTSVDQPLLVGEPYFQVIRVAALVVDAAVDVFGSRGEVAGVCWVGKSEVASVSFELGNTAELFDCACVDEGAGVEVAESSSST